MKNRSKRRKKALSNYRIKKDSWRKNLNEQERKARTHRLITRRAIIESPIENAEELTDEDIKILLEEAIKTKEFKGTLRVIMKM